MYIVQYVQCYKMYHNVRNKLNYQQSSGYTQDLMILTEDWHRGRLHQHR